VVDGPAVDRCLADKVFRWYGDSQTRTVFNHAMLRLCGVEKPADKGFETDQCLPQAAFDGCRMRATCYTKDIHGTVVTEQQLHEADVFLSNFGQWCASGEGHVPASSYGQSVRRYFLAVGDELSNVTVDTDPTASMWTSDVGAGGYMGVFPSAMRHVARTLVSGDGAGRDKHVMWMETPPMPLRNDEFIVQYQDWRTPHRLRLFNAIARRWWTEGVQQLRQFASAVQLCGGDLNVTDVRISVAGEPSSVTASVGVDADVAVSMDVGGRVTTQRVHVSYIPMTSRYATVIGMAVDWAHLAHAEALDSTTNAIFAAAGRCSAP
jgi:hypothetical protein